MNAIPALPDLKFVAIDPDKCGLDGRRICYMENGSGPRTPLVLLHGIGSNSTGWRFVLDAMGRKRRVIAWNAPGYMLSDNFKTDKPANTQYADALAAFLDALGLERVDLVGSSFGSLIASTFAARYPARVVRLALLGASRGQRWLPEAERVQRLKGRYESIRNGALDMAASRWTNLVAPNPPPRTAALVQEILKATNKRGFQQSAEATHATDVLAFVGDITAPTLIAVGTEDRVNPPAISKAIHAAIPGSRYAELAGVGHLPKLEAPEETVKLLEEHFQEDAR
jgi:pimeloyl-ACP methyl ester carboxylesterase